MNKSIENGLNAKQTKDMDKKKMKKKPISSTIHGIFKSVQLVISCQICLHARVKENRN